MPQAHVAMGVAHLVGDRRNPAAALAEFTIALEGLPSDADVWAEMAESHRALGHWNDALASFGRAVDLDPRNPGLLESLGLTYVYTRRYADAVQAFDRATASVGNAPAMVNRFALDKANADVLWHGRLDTLEAAAERVSRTIDGQFSPALEYAQLLLWRRNGDKLLATLHAAHTTVLQSSTLFAPAP